MRCLILKSLFVGAAAFSPGPQTTTGPGPSRRSSPSRIGAVKDDPGSVYDISQKFRELYDILGDKAPVYVVHPSKPTIRFSFVTPPTPGKDWTDDDILHADASLMASEESAQNRERISRNKRINAMATQSPIFERVAKRHGSDKPLALYIPGLDGMGVSAATWQFNSMSTTFELWRLSVAVNDKSSFGTLIDSVCSFIENVTCLDGSTRPIYIIGESFGGLLAPAVVMRLQNTFERKGQESPIKGLVLVNPATSFDESNWDLLAPALSSLGDLTENVSLPFGLPSAYSVLGGLTLSTLIPSSNQLERIVGTLMDLDTVQSPAGILDSVQGSLESFQITAEVLPPSLLEHRIKNWMIVGSSLVKSRLHDLQLPTLVVVGTDDRLIDSGKEVERLMQTIPNCEELRVRGAGHFVLDDNVNLTEAILYSKLDPLNFKETKRRYDPILDWELPPKDEIEKEYSESVKRLEDAFSPIFISTNHEGQRDFGLDNLLRDTPLLFVANHQLLGLDLNILISKLIDIGLPARGLAHPVVFQQSGQLGELGGRTPGLNSSPRAGTSNFERFGAVMVTPRNYYRLLQTGQNVLLFPGGVREVFHGKDEAYQIFWPSKVDFVRTASKFNATIIPLVAVGMADSLNIILEPEEVADLPIVGRRAKSFAKNVTAARFDVQDEEESFLPPIVVPGLPSRNYFLFGKPISTSTIDPSNKDDCENVYKALQLQMKEGFEDILVARQGDPYRKAGPRFAYERITGKQAPTFAIEKLNFATSSSQSEHQTK